jgi:hypothetical protein
MQTVVSIILCLLLFGTLACDDQQVEPGENRDEKYPASPLPTGLKEGIWFWGNSGPLSYYDHDGNRVGSSTEAGRQYKFSEVNGQGRLESEQYLGLRNASNCVTEIYSRKKGTVKFEGGNKFTFYPVEGSFRTIKSGTSSSCSNESSERKATGEELLPMTFLYQLKVIDGATLFYIYDGSDINYSNPLFVYQKAE